MATATAKRKKAKGKTKAAAPVQGKGNDGRVPRAEARPKGSEGLIRKSILAEMKRANLSRYQLRNASGVPGTIVFEFLREDKDARGISLRNAEALLAVLGIKLTPPAQPVALASDGADAK